MRSVIGETDIYDYKATHVKLADETYVYMNMEVIDWNFLRDRKAETHVYMNLKVIVWIIYGS